VTKKRTVEYETAAEVWDAGRTRPLIVTLHPGFIEVRQKGSRTSYTIAYDPVYRMAATVGGRKQTEVKG